MKMTIFNAEINEVVNKRINEKKSKWDRVANNLKIMREEIANLMVDIDMWDLSNKDKTPEYNAKLSQVTEYIAKYDEYKDNHKELSDQLNSEIRLLETIKANYPN